MRWNRGYRSNNVDLRGGGGGLPIGALGLLGPVTRRFGFGGVVLLLIFFAVNYFICGGGGGKAPDRDDEGVQFVSFVFDDAQETWSRIFEKNGKRYEMARLVIFRGSTSTACGHGSAAVGPFYCPNDRIVYIDLSFYDELKRRFGAPGDFAQAYVIAHEVGHHVQHQLGLLAGESRGSGPTSSSVRQELQADCLAGVWGHSTQERKLLESGDVEEALRAASAIGDDSIQKQSTGTVQPESWTHGSSAQRMEAFKRGFASGRMVDCDTTATRGL